MDFRHLRYFVAVVDAGGMSQARASLGLVQSALSQAIAELEETLGVVLLDRSARGVSPTDAGAALYLHARKILKLIDDSAEVVRHTRHPTSGKVRLGLPVSIGTMVVPTLLARLQQHYPEVKVEVDEYVGGHQGTSLLTNNRLDLCVLVDDQSLASEIDSAPFLRERFCFVRRRNSGPALPRSVTLETVAEYPLVLSTSVTPLRAVVARQFSQALLKPVIVAETNSGQTIMSLIAEGVGASLLPYAVFACDPHAEDIEYCAVEPAFYRIASLATSRLYPMTDACASVRALLYEIAAHLVHTGQWKGAAMSERAT